MSASWFNILQRAKTWKTLIELRVEQLEIDFKRFFKRYEFLSEMLDALQREHSALLVASRNGLFSVFAEECYCYSRRRNRVRVLRVSAGLDPPYPVGSVGSSAIANAIINGEVHSIESARLEADGSHSAWEAHPWVLEQFKERPFACRSALEQFALKPNADTSVIDHSAAEAQKEYSDANSVDAKCPESEFFKNALQLIARHPNLIDFVALAQSVRVPMLAGTASGLPLPFDQVDELPSVVPAEPKRRSVVFLHNSYYHFNTLAAALRRRGWEAITVSVESPTSPQRQFYIGEDVNLYSDDVETRRKRVREFVKLIPERFGTLHFCGQGQQSFFTENYEHAERRTKVPWDFLELRRHRIIMGYSPSGCLDGARQSSIRKISGNVCGRCVWELRPDVCRDPKSGAWAETLETICDWVGLEGDWAVDERTGPKFVRGPVTYTLDPDYWSPDLEVPATMRLERQPGEILVYHAVGNVETRRNNGRDIKGTNAVEAAIAKLQAEGIPLKLFFASNISITQVRYYKVQADIVIDQLNYGRIGANGREALMLGCPVITRLAPEQQAPLPPLRSVVEAPALNATEQTVESVLRDLALDSNKRNEMSHQSRAFALKWFAADVCARRFETVIDRVANGQPPETDELYPPATPDATDAFAGDRRSA